MHGAGATVRQQIGAAYCPPAAWRGALCGSARACTCEAGRARYRPHAAMAEASSGKSLGSCPAGRRHAPHAPCSQPCSGGGSCCSGRQGRQTTQSQSRLLSADGLAPHAPHTSQPAFVRLYRGHAASTAEVRDGPGAGALGSRAPQRKRAWRPCSQVFQHLSSGAIPSTASNQRLTSVSGALRPPRRSTLKHSACFGESSTAFPPVARPGPGDQHLNSIQEGAEGRCAVYSGPRRACALRRQRATLRIAPQRATLRIAPPPFGRWRRQQQSKPSAAVPAWLMLGSRSSARCAACST